MKLLSQLYKTVVQRGEKPVGRVTSAQRGQLPTLCCGINAMGNFIPPLMIYPQVHFKESIILGAPATDGAALSSG